MSLYKRGQTWWLRIAVGGKEVRESTGASDKKAAEEFHALRSSQLWRNHKLGERTIYWVEAAAAWVEHHAIHKKSFADDRHKIGTIADSFKGLTLPDVTTERLTTLRDSLRGRDTGNSIATANRHLATASAVLNFAHERAWIVGVPKIPYLPEPDNGFRWITREEARRLIIELPAHLSRMTKLSLATGLRRANVTGLQWDCVDLARRVAWVWPDEAKAGKALGVPLNDDAAEVLRECLGDDPDFVFVYKGNPVTRTKTKAWDKALVRAGIEAMRWHDLRHTWASWHVMGGTPLQVLQQLGGWASLDMVLKYAHLAPGYLAGYADAVNFRTNSGTVLDAEKTETENIEEKQGLGGVADGDRTHDNRNHKPTLAPVIPINQEVTKHERKKRRG